MRLQTPRMTPAVRAALLESARLVVKRPAEAPPAPDWEEDDDAEQARKRRRLFEPSSPPLLLRPRV